MGDGIAPSLAVLDDEELVELYRRAGPGSEMGEHGALEEEMVRRGLMPDREKTIPDEPIPQHGWANGPVDVLPPGPDSAAGENGEDSLPA